MLLVLSLVMRAQCFIDDATSRCSFCSTNKGGFTGSLKGHEIVKQVLSQQPASCHLAMKDRCKPCASLEFHPTPSRVPPPSSGAQGMKEQYIAKSLEYESNYSGQANNAYKLILDEMVDFVKFTVEACKMDELAKDINLKVTLQRKLQDKRKNMPVYKLKSNSPCTS